MALDLHHRAVVPAKRGSDTVLRVLGLAVAGEDDARLGPDHELCRAGGGVVLERERPELRGPSLLDERQRLHGLGEVARVPPQDHPVRRARHGLRPRLGLRPRHVKHRVPVAVLDLRDDGRAVALADVEQRELPVVLASADDVAVLVVEVRHADLAERPELKLGRVGVVQVPDVAVPAHPLGLLLELEDGVGGDHLPDGGVGVPRDVGDPPLDGVGVAEDGDRLHGGRLVRVVRALPAPVLLVDVDGVVLLDQVLDRAPETDHRVDVLLVLLDLLAVADDVLGLREVDLLRPTPFVVADDLVRVDHRVGVCLVLRHLGHHLCNACDRVPLNVLVGVLFVRPDVCQHLCTLIYELRMPPELPSGLCVAVVHLHCVLLLRFRSSNSVLNTAVLFRE
mmetsp:Transcript_8826/g.21321  ORF Transcript_8826/g.21321 Transcript_8826/m.21321 type:complete len:394 (-) Transcript_8826:141-1322(-)